MSDKLKNRFESFEEAPQKEVWDNIKSQIPKHKFNFLAAFTISGAAILLLGIAILLVSNPTNINKEETVVFEKENISLLETKQIEKVSVDNNNKTIADNSAVEETTKPVINNINEDIALTKTNNTNQSNIIPAEKKIQIKEIDNTSLKIVNPFPANSIIPITKPNKPIEIVNNIEEKSSPAIEDDTISTRRELFIPNAFTPRENDNNTFKPAYTKLKSYEMNIFNRNGVLLFTSKDIRLGWDGYYKGSLCELGAYGYVIRYENMEGHKFKEQGLVSLIR
ncbi:MAG TPA: T9SS type B sorting domain-containing protein [Bacteroidales bacterium]|nr:T9SS type B sorting domain-containing protein [Bacteroidales bacterium]